MIIKSELINQDNLVIRNKLQSNYDISKQINEINGNTDRGKTEEEKRITIPEEKKIVAFVGAHGNGTSFIINNLALLLSEQGIKTAIVDLTKIKILIIFLHKTKSV